MSQEISGTALAIAKLNQLTFEEVEKWGKIFFQSGYFTDMKGYAGAMVKVKAGDELGIAPFASMSGIFIIKGKAWIGSKLQAALVQSSEHVRYEVVALDDTQCALEFFKRGVIDEKWKSVGISEFSMENARAAHLADKDNTQTGRGQNGDMYRKYSRNMLFARAMTNGVSWYCPEILKGNSGTAGVSDDFDVEEIVGETSQSAEEADRQPEQTARPVAEEREAGAVKDEAMIDDEVVTGKNEVALRMEIYAELERLTDNDPEEVERLLNGRVMTKMTAEHLKEYRNSLRAMETPKSTSKR